MDGQVCLRSVKIICIDFFSFAIFVLFKFKFSSRMFETIADHLWQANIAVTYA